jgi:hypothetical protein
LGQLKGIYSEKMMSPAADITPSRIGTIKIIMGIGDSSLDESFFSFISSALFPASRRSSDFQFWTCKKSPIPFWFFVEKSLGNLLLHHPKVLRA